MSKEFFAGLQQQVDDHKAAGGFNPLNAVDAIKRFAGDKLFGSAKPLQREDVPFRDTAVNKAAKMAHPGIAIIDAVSERMGGPSVADGFKQGVTVSGDIRTPPMPF